MQRAARPTGGERPRERQHGRGGLSGARARLAGGDRLEQVKAGEAHADRGGAGIKAGRRGSRHDPAAPSPALGGDERRDGPALMHGADQVWPAPEQIEPLLHAVSAALPYAGAIRSACRAWSAQRLPWLDGSADPGLRNARHRRAPLWSALGGPMPPAVTACITACSVGRVVGPRGIVASSSLGQLACRIRSAKLMPSGHGTLLRPKRGTDAVHGGRRTKPRRSVLRVPWLALTRWSPPGGPAVGRRCVWHLLCANRASIQHAELAG